MATEAAIKTLQENLQVKGEKLVEKIQGIVQFCIGGETWTLDLTEGKGSVVKGDSESDPDVALTMSDDTFAKLVNGKTSPQQAFMFGRLKVKGSIGMAMKVIPVLEAARPAKSKL